MKLLFDIFPVALFFIALRKEHPVFGLGTYEPIVTENPRIFAHIRRYGSLHTEAIVTRDYHNSQRFLREVNSGVVMVNASSRFSDGNQLGLGAEIGISTTKLHSFGPMGLEDLTTRKFVVLGDGQVRQ